MFRAFEIRGFRCFDQLRLEGLQRVNLIAGKNNTGKTALLEAIRLHCNPNDCHLAHGIMKDRGASLYEKLDLDHVIAWLFHDRQREVGIDLMSEPRDGESRRLRIVLVPHAQALRDYPEASAGLLSNIAQQSHFRIDGPKFVFEFRSGEVHGASIGFLQGHGQMSWMTNPTAIPIANVFLGTATDTTEMDLRLLGDLEGAKREGEVLPALKVLEPRMQRLTLIPFGGAVVPHADIGLSRLVPLNLMGEGVRRLLSLVLAITATPGGVVLIDEIENGLHHSALEGVWKALATAARAADVQLFATTHSYECIAAAHRAFDSADPYDFALHRLDRRDKTIVSVTYDRESIGYALEMSHEVR